MTPINKGSIITYATMVGATSPITASFPNYWNNCLASINTGNDHPTLVWESNPNFSATNYIIYRQFGSGVFQIIDTNGPNTFTWTDQSININSTPIGAIEVNYYVLATNNQGSSQTNTLSFEPLNAGTVPVTPANFTLTTSSGNHPYLSWTLNPEPDVTSNSSNGYVLEKRTGSTFSPHNWGSWSVIPLSGTTNHYEDILITVNSSDQHKMAEYRLRAYDNVYYSDYTNSLDISYGFVAEKTKGNSTNNKNLTTYDLLQNFPNPFNPTTQLSFSIPNPSFTQLKVYDVFGREITTLVNEFLQEGIYNYEFNGKKLASGVYFYTLTAGNYSETKKMVLTK